MRTAIYARVSTDEQAQKYGLESQVEACREYCATHEYQIVREYREDFTGTEATRPELDALLQHASSGLFDIVVMYSVDRMARSLHVQLVLEKEFADLEVSVEYVHGGGDNSPEGVMMRQIQSVISEYEVAQIKRRMRRGQKARIKSGKVQRGRTPAYGYDYNQETGKYEINEDQATVIRDIFDWYTKGDESGRKLGALLIAKKLTDLGVPTAWDIHGIQKKKRCRKSWGLSSIARILENENYKGVYLWGSEQIPVEIPAIVSESQWNAAQQQKQKNLKRSPRNTKETYLLQYRLTCGTCGYSFSSQLDSGKRKYRCGGNQRNRADNLSEITCHGSISADYLDTLAWNMVADFVSKPDDFIEAIERKASKNSERAERLARHEAQLNDLEASQERLIDLYADGTVSRGDLNKRINEIQENITRTKALIATNQPSELLDPKAIKAFADKLQKLIKNPTEEKKKRIFEVLDVSGVVTERRTPTDADLELTLKQGSETAQLLSHR